MADESLVPVFWLRHIVDDLHNHSSLVDQTLAKIGLDRVKLQDPEAGVHQEQEAAFLNVMARGLNESFLGAEVGFRLDLRRTTLLSYLIYNSHDLHQALDNLVRFLPLMRPSSSLSMEKTPDGVLMRLNNRNRQLAGDAQYMEFCVALFVNALRRACGRVITPTSIAFFHAASPGRSELPNLFGCPVSYDASVTTIVLDPSSLDHKVVQGDPNLFREMFGYGQLLLRQRRPEQHSLVDDVARFLMQHMARRSPSVEEAAETLGVSTRTLARRLAEAGTTYRKLTEEIRIDLAKTRLKDSLISLAEITYLLGYTEQSSFSFAFKRATGLTPGQFRKTYSEKT